MQFLDKTVSPLGLGCWPIGGEMYGADGTSLGYSQSDDAESIKAIHAALANGIQIFDTAAAYGAGHSERLLAKGLKDRTEAVIVTKIGFAIDESSKTLTGDDVAPTSVMPAIEHCLSRLNRDSIDLLLLHHNALPVSSANAVFNEMEEAQKIGKIKAFGWSTDYVDSAAAMASRVGFVAVEHAMHVLMDAPNMQQTVQQHKLNALIRSPLAMGLLSGKYTVDSKLNSNDVRSANPGWAKYYIDGKPNPRYVTIFNSVRELLQTGGRTSVQGALGWLWAKSPTNIPIPGARTVKQVEELAAAIEFGPLPNSVKDEIDTLVGDVFHSDGKSER